MDAPQLTYHSGQRLRIGVIFDNLGPYHVARLQAAAARADIGCIEVTAASAEYAWQRTRHVCDFTRFVLFDPSSGELPAGGELRARVVKALDTMRPDVLAIPGWSYAAALIAQRWCGRNGIPTVVMSDSTVIDAPRYRAIEFVKSLIVRSNSAALVAGTRSAAYIEQLGMRRERIFAGYDVVDNAHFAEGALRVRQDAEAQRRALGLPARYFLTICRFVEKKNLPHLIEAYAAYRRQAPRDPLDLVILGDGVLRGDLEALRDGLGLAGHVHLPGFMQYPDLPRYYGLATAFVLASTVEQWGLVVNEALASGLPVAVSERCGCAPDLVAEGVNGYTFDPCGTTAIAAALHRLAHDSDLARMGAASRAIADKWPIERFAEGLLAAAKAALSGRRAPNAHLLGLLRPLTG